jgi:hypothetical protein
MKAEAATQRHRGFAMSKSFQLCVLALILTVGGALAAPASAEQAKEPKQKKQAASKRPAQVSSAYRGTDKFRAGPLYHGNDYLGDDPDPFIRLQIQRDLSWRYGGDD